MGINLPIGSHALSYRPLVQLLQSFGSGRHRGYAGRGGGWAGQKKAWGGNSCGDFSDISRPHNLENFLTHHLIDDFSGRAL